MTCLHSHTRGKSSNKKKNPNGSQNGPHFHNSELGTRLAAVGWKRTQDEGKAPRRLVASSFSTLCRHAACLSPPRVTASSFALPLLDSSRNRNSTRAAARTVLPLFSLSRAATPNPRQRRTLVAPDEPRMEGKTG